MIKYKNYRIVITDILLSTMCIYVYYISVQSPLLVQRLYIFIPLVSTAFIIFQWNISIFCAMFLYSHSK